MTDISMPVMKIYHQPVPLLQKLIQFDTTNPPGNEAECITFINELLYGHVDVVTTASQQWQHPPFEGKIADGYLWGRGALDMKGGVAMMLAAFLRAKTSGLALPGDVILAAVPDEETGGEFGAKFLVEKHPELFSGVRYAIGEFGGFTFTIENKTFYPIQVAEKQLCWMKATVRGMGGHGSMPVRGGAMAGLARLLQQLDRHRLPVHITPVPRAMISRVAATTGGISGLLIGMLKNPLLTDRVLDLIGLRGRLFDALLHNTVSPTVLRASEQMNVIPSEVSIGLDGRLLPGYRPEDMLKELRAIIGNDIELEVVHYCEGPGKPDMGLYPSLVNILQEAEPGCVPIPLLMSGVTDGRFFSRLGIQTYGFLPMPLPQGFDFTRTIHAADERVPVAALDFGTDAIYRVLSQFGQ